MDTLINISSAANRSNILRSVLILAGIMIAIICSLVSLKTLDSREAAEARTWGSMETPAIVTANFVMKASAAMGHSVMVLTKEWSRQLLHNRTHLRNLILQIAPAPIQHAVFFLTSWFFPVPS